MRMPGALSASRDPRRQGSTTPVVAHLVYCHERR